MSDEKGNDIPKVSIDDRTHSDQRCKKTNNCMVCVGGAPQPSQQDPDVILVDELYPTEEEYPPFDHKEVVRIRNNAKFEQFYDIDGEPIGEGKFGKVYHCVEKSTGLELAAKFIKIRKDADREQVEHEVSVMTRMRHPRIAWIYDAFYSTNNDVILVMELVKGGELFNRVVEDNFVLTEAAAAVIICQLCEAIDYIHRQNIVHLDIKPENIMCVTESGNRIKLIDFGLARHYDGSEDLYYMAGTPEFSAPEVIKFEPLDFHTDMWSVGVITYILLSGYSPFLGETTPLTYMNVERGEWEFIEEFDCVSEVAKDFISKLLVYDKSLRMLPKECLSHPWLANVRERAQKDVLLDQPNIGPAIPTDKLRRYNIRRRFRKATFAVMSYCEFAQILNVLRQRNSANGLEYFGKAKVEGLKKKKKSLAGAVLAMKNAEAQSKVEPAVVVTDCEPSTAEVQEEAPESLKVEKKMLKTESSDSTKENKAIPTVVIGENEAVARPGSELPPAPDGVPKKKKIVRKKKPVRETPARTSELDLLRTQAEGVKPSKKLVAEVRQTGGSGLSSGLSSGEEREKPKRRSFKTSTEENATTSTKTENETTTTTNSKQTLGDANTSIVKTITRKVNDEMVKKVESKTEGASKSPSTSRGSFDVPKPRVNSLIAERMQKLQSDAPPLTFSISGKKDPLKSSNENETPKRGFKELTVITEKKSTTTTTTQVKSKIENTERKLTTRTADKNIEEIIGKRSTQQEVSQVTTAEEKCPETGLQKKTFQKSVAKKEKLDKEEEKNRKEELLGDEKTTIKTQRSLKREENDKAVLEKLTKVDGETKDNKKLELNEIRLRKIDGKAMQEIEGDKKTLQNVEITLTSKTRRSLLGKDGSREEKIEKERKFETKINVGKKPEPQEGVSLLQELSRLRKTGLNEVDHPLKSALKREGSNGERKSVKLSDIMLPRIRLEEERGATRVKFTEATPAPPFPTTSTLSFGGLQKNKSETNIAAKVKSSLHTSTKQKTLDDSGVVKKREHWLFTDGETEVRPREDFSFGALKELLERRVSGDPTDLLKPKETIKIPNANFAMNKWRQLERTD
ncbi:unnamed protein product, partial [Mesorhabditis belari]|uniref:Protein kinase domain-containing protein n=1 Tax=Mesorhabditis belari TaxID=2138241 RepID=A0AAF3FKR2_9BILA